MSNHILCCSQTWNYGTHLKQQENFNISKLPLYPNQWLWSGYIYKSLTEKVRGLYLMEAHSWLCLGASSRLTFSGSGTRQGCSRIPRSYRCHCRPSGHTSWASSHPGCSPYSYGEPGKSVRKRHWYKTPFPLIKYCHYDR